MKLILKITTFFAFVFFLQSIIFRFFPNIPSEPTNQIDAALKYKPDVVLVGDSVIISPYSQDLDRRPVNLMLQDMIPNIKLSSLDSLAYASEVFLQQVSYITRNEFKPKLIIIPINIRSFSPHWDPRWDFQFEMDKLTLKYKNTPVFPYLKFLINFNLFNLMPISKSQFLNTPVFSKDVQIGIMKDFEGPDYNTYTDLHQKNKILLSYTYTLSKNHRKLKALEETAGLLSKNNIKAIFYLTPVDYETAGKFTGDFAKNQITQNINLIKNSLNKYPVKVLDLSFRLPTNNFAWKDALYINEHLNQNGRRFLAQELANSIIDSLKNSQ